MKSIFIRANREKPNIKNISNYSLLFSSNYLYPYFSGIFGYLSATLFLCLNINILLLNCHYKNRRGLFKKSLVFYVWYITVGEERDFTVVGIKRGLLAKLAHRKKSN